MFNTYEPGLLYFYSIQSRKTKRKKKNRLRGNRHFNRKRRIISHPASSTGNVIWSILTQEEWDAGK